jgi:hypothetical protein
MSLLQSLGNGTGYLKAGFLGFQGSGKTFTAIDLAIGTRERFGLKGPIAMFDTEAGSSYIAERVRERTGLDLVGTRSMALDTLIATTRECEREGVSVLVVDSITHVWREACDSHLAAVNAGRQAKRLPKRHTLEFQDYNAIKQRWAVWTALYLNSRLHIIICGRAGYEYDYDTNEETGKKELVKTGTKMKAETEFGFEPSLVIEMERVRELGKGRGKARAQHVHRATVLKDRFGIIDGREFTSPTFKSFEPHVSRLTPGAHAPIDTALKSDPGIDADGNDERKLRTILCEEIQAELIQAYPSTSVAEKTAKIGILKEVFNTGSWTAVETMSAAKLRDGLARIRTMLQEPAAPAPAMGEAGL